MTRPRLAITLGDPAGIGPEIAVAALADAVARAEVTLFGHRPALERALADRGAPARPRFLNDLPARREEGEIVAVHTGTGEGPGLSPAAAGESQLRAIDLAVDALLAGRCDALVTGPVSKSAIAAVAPGFTGHTEHLAARCGIAPDAVTMVFASRALAVGLVATHLPMRAVPDSLTRARCERTLRHVAGIAAALGNGRSPRIAVAALNPHAGEDGLLGREELEILGPFCEGARRAGFDVAGPIAADAVFRDALAGAYDGVIAAYHDQAMIPLKLGGFGRCANVTAGLPFVRTSPDHGVARDLAGTGRADPSGMRLAVELAVELAAARRGGAPG